MPELPEVETSCRGIRPHLLGQTITKVVVREPRLRWRIENEIYTAEGHEVISVARRAKYILVDTGVGHMILHLGMSGSLRVCQSDTAVSKHDHVDICLNSGQCVRYNDPRRFGALVWTDKAPFLHPLLASLGPEPLSEDFSGDYLWRKASGKKQLVKSFIMDSSVVVGVGNIYASEALFKAGILPTRQAGKVSRQRYHDLVDAIKETLQAAIKSGGTTLKDFVSTDGKPGYFKQKLLVYQRTGEPCVSCQAPIKQKRLNQRSTFYCTSCQR